MLPPSHSLVGLPYAGKRFIFEKAKELGVRSVIIDGPESWSQVIEEAGSWH
jgi:carnosine synthase